MNTFPFTFALNVRSDCLLWPLTRRGLISEILVFSYVQAVADFHGVDVIPLSSPSCYSYWKKLFPGLKIKISMLPSSYLSPVRSKEELKLLTNLTPFKNHVASKSIFRRLWSSSAEEYYSKKFNIYHATAENIKKFLVLNINFDPDTLPKINSFNAIHFRRGDKVFGDCPEAECLSIDKYVKATLATFEKDQPVLLIGDSCASLELLKCALEDLGYLYLTIRSPLETISIKGYDQQAFNRLSESKKVLYNQSFLRDFSALVSATSLISTFSSNIGIAAALCRANKNTFSLDSHFAIVR